MPKPGWSPLTSTEAADLNTAFLRDVADNIVAAAPEAPIRGYAAFRPPESASFFASVLSPSIGLIEAWYPNFGDCLFAAIAQLFERGHAAAVVLNSDSPTLPTSLLIDTAERLARPGDRAILGPSRDGGYYLLGLKAPHRRLFEQVAWSTELVAAQTLDRAAEIGLDVEVLPEWYDVDDAGSLRMLCAELDEAAPAPNGLRRHAEVRNFSLSRVAPHFDRRGLAAGIVQARRDQPLTPARACCRAHVTDAVEGWLIPGRNPFGLPPLA